MFPMFLMTTRTRALALLLLSFACGARRAAAQPGADSLVARPRITMLPVIGSAPETGFQFGITALRMYRLGSDTSTRTSQQQAYAVYTTKSQARGFLQVDRWSRGNEWRVRGRAEYQSFPLPFYGIGDGAPDEAEEWYTSSGPSLQLLVQRRVSGPVFVGGAALVTDVTIRELEPGRALAAGAVLGARGGTVVQAQGFIARDSRDHVLAARRGQLLQLTATLSERTLGSDYNFGRYALDTRRYWSFGSAGHVIAAQILAEATSGRAPFDQLVQVGGDNAFRGYTRGRYRDRHGLYGQAEYRSPFVKRLGMVAFAGGGGVAPSLDKLVEAQLLPTFGIGLRALLVPAQRATIRIDYARGKGSSGLYIGLSEAF